MRAFEFYRKGKATILPTMAAVREGLTVHRVEVAKSYRQGEHYDFALCWGWRQDERLRALGWTGPVLYAEMGYVSSAPRFTSQHGYKDFRIHNISFCWNGCHGQSDDYIGDAPADRWDRLGVDLKPWRNDGTEVVILGQTELDPVAIPPGEEKAWNERLVPAVEDAFRPLPVRFRPHPRYTDFSGPSLLADTASAACVVTYSSTAAVETICAGIPTCVLSPLSIARPVASHELEEPLYRGERIKWASNLAYRQWEYPEIESGEFWNYVRRGI